MVQNTASRLRKNAGTDGSVHSTDSHLTDSTFAVGDRFVCPRVFPQSARHGPDCRPTCICTESPGMASMTGDFTGHAAVVACEVRDLDAVRRKLVEAERYAQGDRRRRERLHDAGRQDRRRRWMAALGEFNPILEQPLRIVDGAGALDE